MRKAIDKTQGDEIGANRHDDRNRVWNSICRSEPSRARAGPEL